MKLNNIFRLGVKELRGIARDPMMLVLIVYAFSVSIYTAAASIPETLSKASIAIVDEDRSPLSARIGDSFYPPYFLPPVYISRDEMDARMDAGLDTFALDIPPNFQRDVLAGKTPTLQLNVDATRMSQAFSGNGYIQQIITDAVSEFTNRYRGREGYPVSVAARARFNPELNETWFSAIVEIINNVTMLSVILAGTALIREREHGTVEHLMVMPVSPAEIMIAKIWSMALVVMVASYGAVTIIVQGALHVPIEGSIALFMLGTLFQLFATTSLGIFLATLAGSMPQFGLLLMLVLLPLQILSGGLTPRESMPLLVRDIMMAAPNTHFVMLAQSILYRGAGLSVVWPNFLALAVIGSVLFTISLGRFRKFLR